MRGRSFVGSDRSRIRVLGRSESGASRGRRRCWSRRVGLPLAAVVGGPGAVGRPGASVTVPGPTGRHRSGALAPAPEASIAETPPFPVELPPLADVVAGPCLHVELSVVRSHAMSSCRRCAARSASTVSNDSRSSSFVNSAWTCPRRHLPTGPVVVVGAAQRGGGAGGTFLRAEVVVLDGLWVPDPTEPSATALVLDGSVVCEKTREGASQVGCIRNLI